MPAGAPGSGLLPDAVPSPAFHRKHCVTPAGDIALCSGHPGHPALAAPGPHQPTSALTPSQPHRPVELRVSRAPAFAPALAAARAPPGALDLVPRLRPLLGLSACQPLPGGASGLQGADQRHGRPGPVGAGGRAVSGRAAPRAPAAAEEPQHTLDRGPGAPPCCLGPPQGPRPLWGSGTLHCTGSLHTGWGACTPHIPATCGSPNSPAPLGPDTVPQPVGRTTGCLRELPPRVEQGGGRREGEGRPRLSPALPTKSRYCGPCPRA